MQRIVIDASVPNAQVKLGREGDTFVLVLPGVEIVFLDSKGSLYGAAVLAGAIGTAVADRAQDIINVLVATAEDVASTNGEVVN